VKGRDSDLLCRTTQHFPSENTELGKRVRISGIEAQPAAIFRSGETFLGGPGAGKVKLTTHTHLII